MKLIFQILLVISMLSTSSSSLFAFNTNQEMIESLNKQDGLDLNNIDQVFYYVLSMLNNQIIVYPSEGYYYFDFFHKGNLIKGNIRFGSEHRNNGKLFFVYFYEIAGQERSDFKTKMKLYSKNEIFSLVAKKNSEYILSYKDLKKRVFINQLNQNNVFVNHLTSFGFQLNIPMMDDSGIVFYLSFHPKTNQFYYINDRSIDNEFYFDYKGLKIGSRSQFVYVPFNDEALILIGVANDNVERNNHYDGPFDQLPDEEISKINFKSYLEKMSPNLIGEISNSGIFLNEVGSRVAITNYIEYKNLSELNKIKNCSNEKFTRFISCLQKEIDKSVRSH